VILKIMQLFLFI